MPDLAFSKLYHIRLEAKGGKEHLGPQIQSEIDSCKTYGIYYELIDFQYCNLFNYLLSAWQSSFLSFILSRHHNTRVIFRHNCFNPFAIFLSMCASRRLLFLFHTKYFCEFKYTRHSFLLAPYIVLFNTFFVKLFSRRFLAVTPEVALADTPTCFKVF